MFHLPTINGCFRCITHIAVSFFREGGEKVTFFLGGWVVGWLVGLIPFLKIKQKNWKNSTPECLVVFSFADVLRSLKVTACRYRWWWSPRFQWSIFRGYVSLRETITIYFFASFVNMFGEVTVLSKDLVKHQYYMVVSNISYFHPYLGRWPHLTNIFQRGWNHQLDYISGESVVFVCFFWIIQPATVQGSRGHLLWTVHAPRGLHTIHLLWTNHTCRRDSWRVEGEGRKGHSDEKYIEV